MAISKKEASPIKVVAIKEGFFGGKYRAEGDSFTLHAVGDSKELTEKQFSAKWMKKV